ncbi:hypothetical protein LguiB_013776 [Lonicera macranthoides]
MRMASISKSSSGGFDMRLYTMRDVVEVVRDDSIRIIGICGICGMGGVGKKAREERSMWDGAKVV